MPSGYIAGGSKYLKPYSSAEHTDGRLGLIIAIIVVVFAIYIIYRVRKQMEEDEAYLKKKREIISKWSRGTYAMGQKAIKRILKK